MLKFIWTSGGRNTFSHLLENVDCSKDRRISSLKRKKKAEGNSSDDDDDDDVSDDVLAELANIEDDNDDIEEFSDLDDDDDDDDDDIATSDSDCDDRNNSKPTGRPNCNAVCKNSDINKRPKLMVPGKKKKDLSGKRKNDPKINKQDMGLGMITTEAAKKNKDISENRMSGLPTPVPCSNLKKSRGNNLWARDSGQSFNE